jgi:hypothetical protein
MSSILIDTLESLVIYVQRVVGENVEVQRNYLPAIDTETLESLGCPLVIVVPTKHKIQSETASKNLHKFDIDLTVSAKLNQRNSTLDDQVAEIDTLIKLSEHLLNHFTMKKYIASSGIHSIVCKDPEQVILVDYETLEESNCFFSVIRLKVELIDDKVS